MNQYLAKLHSLESAAESPGKEKPLLTAPPKLPKLGSVGFGSTRTMGFSGAGPVEEASEIDRAMQFNVAQVEKNASYENRQNRRNPEQKSITDFRFALSDLERECPSFIEPERWQQCVADAHAFIAAWGEQAAALGWSARDLLGLHTPPTKPHPSYSRLSRYDCTGLIWLLQGRSVVALTATTAAIKNTSTGNVTVYRRYNKPALGPVGDSLDDFTA